jgi:hypothetical protein
MTFVVLRFRKLASGLLDVVLLLSRCLWAALVYELLRQILAHRKSGGLGLSADSIHQSCES